MKVKRARGSVILPSLASALLLLPASLAVAQESTTPAQSTQAGLTIDAVARQAVKASERVSAAEAGVRQASRAVSLGRSAFAPQLNLSASYARLSEIPLQTITFGGQEIELFPQILNNYSMRAGLRVPLSDYFLTILPQYKAGKHAAALAGHQAEAQRQTVAYKARDLYFSLAGAQAQTTVANHAVELLAAYQADLQALVDAGQATKADLLAAEAQQATAEIAVARSHGLVEALSQEMRNTLGLDDKAPLAVRAVAVGDGTVPITLPPYAEMVREAVGRRHEIKALREVAKASQLAVRASRGSALPALSLAANYNYSNPNSRYVPSQEEWDGTWDVGVVLSWSPNVLATSTVQAEAKELDVVRAQSDLAELEKQLRVEVSRARSDYQASLIAIRASEKAVAASREAWTSRRELLAAGEASGSEVLEAQNALLQAETGKIDALVAAKRTLERIHYLQARSI
jgi:outer membrane protein TolC